jgi:hypothetical protein
MINVTAIQNLVFTTNSIESFLESLKSPYYWIHLIIGVAVALIVGYCGKRAYGKISRDLGLTERWKELKKKDLKKRKKNIDEIDKYPDLMADVKHDILYYNTSYIGCLLLAVLFLVFLYLIVPSSNLGWLLLIPSLLLLLFVLRDFWKVIYLRNLIKDTNRGKKRFW